MICSYLQKKKHLPKHDLPILQIPCQLGNSSENMIAIFQPYSARLLPVSCSKSIQPCRRNYCVGFIFTYNWQDAVCKTLLLRLGLSRFLLLTVLIALFPLTCFVSLTET